MTDLLNKHPNILVIGDLMIDHYFYGNCDRISPEAPVQVLNVDKEISVLGGAGNVLNNLKTLGAKVKILSVTGQDDNGKKIKEILDNLKIDNHLIAERNRKTSIKNRLIASNQQIIRYDNESIEDIDNIIQMALIQLFEKEIKNYDIVLLSDYGKGVLTNKVTKEIIKITNNNNKKVLVDPKGKDYSKYSNAYLLTPNKKEAQEATNINITDKKSLEKTIKNLKNNYNLNTSIITLSEDGIAIYDKNLRIKPTYAKEVYDVTGAGDTVLASIGFALGCNYDIDQAIDFANLAAGVVVGKIGSATATLNEIINYKSSLNKTNSYSHIKTLKEIKQISKELKQKNKKIVFTNGCFDILHVGHVKYLEKAKSFGDILILGLNSDDSVKRLKGENRPINTEKDRAYILAALECIDYIVMFNEDTPYDLIKEIKPNILVKGGDYEGKTVIGQDLVDELKLVNFVKGRSTTNTIKRIEKNARNN